MDQNEPLSITWKITLAENPFYFRYKIILANLLSSTIISVSIFFFLEFPIWVKLIFIGLIIIGLPITIQIQRSQKLEIAIDADGIKTVTKVVRFKRETNVSWNMLKNSVLKVEYNDEYKGIIIYTSFFGENRTIFSPLRYLFLRASSYIFLPVIDKTASVKPLAFINSKIGKG